MGYSTDFFGAFDVTPPLTPEHGAYLRAFADTRRMRRNAEVTATYPDPIREAVGLPVGLEAGYYVGGGDDHPHDFQDRSRDGVPDIRCSCGTKPDGIPPTFPGNFKGQAHTPDVLDYNNPPGLIGWDTRAGESYAAFADRQKAAVASGAQPGLWCQWVPSADGTRLEWDGGEKFYDYVAWLRYLIDNFLKPWGYTVSGEVEWQGEERDDVGKMVVTDNRVATLRPAKTRWLPDDD